MDTNVMKYYQVPPNVLLRYHAENNVKIYAIHLCVGQSIDVMVVANKPKNAILRYMSMIPNWNGRFNVSRYDKSKPYYAVVTTLKEVKQDTFVADGKDLKFSLVWK